MVKRWLTRKEPGWRQGAVINGFGALCTSVVLAVFSITKFLMGAWVVVLLIPVMVVMFLRIRNHYEYVRQHLSLEGYCPTDRLKNTVCVLVSGVNRGVLPALDYARAMSTDVRGVYVEIDPEQTDRVHEKWAKWAPDIPLVVLESPYRALTEPVLRYLDQVEQERSDDIVTVIIPEFVAPRDRKSVV